MPCVWRGMKFIFLFLSLFAALSMLEKANASNMIISWNPSVSPNVTGYDVYYGTTSGNYPYRLNAGAATTITISNLIPGTKYYFAATAYAAVGKQSSFSAPAEATIPQLLTSEPQPVTTSSQNGGATSRPGASFSGSPVATVQARPAKHTPADTAAEPARRVAADLAAAPKAVEPDLAPIVNLTMTRSSRRAGA